jgi:hypothetical protein
MILVNAFLAAIHLFRFRLKFLYYNNLTVYHQSEVNHENVL